MSGMADEGEKGFLKSLVSLIKKRRVSNGGGQQSQREAPVLTTDTGGKTCVSVHGLWTLAYDPDPVFLF